MQLKTVCWKWQSLPTRLHSIHSFAHPLLTGMHSAQLVALLGKPIARPELPAEMPTGTLAGWLAMHSVLPAGRYLVEARELHFEDTILVDWL